MCGNGEPQVLRCKVGAAFGLAVILLVACAVWTSTPASARPEVEISREASKIDQAIQDAKDQHAANNQLLSSGKQGGAGGQGGPRTPQGKPCHAGCKLCLLGVCHD